MNPVAALRLLGRPYVLLCAAQWVTTAGSTLTGFAMGVWSYESSGHALDVAVLQVAATLPALLVLPWAGSVADRMPRRRVVLACDAIVGLATALVAFAAWSGQLVAWQLLLLSLVGSVARAFHWPAFRAFASMFLAPDQAARGSGLMTFADEAVTLLAPVCAGMLMAAAGIQLVLVVDVALLALGAGIVLRLAVPPGLVAAVLPSPVSGGWLRAAWLDLRQTAAFFGRERLLRALLLYTMLQSALVGLVTMLITPLMLANFSSIELGWILAVGGLGGVCGSGLLVLASPARGLMSALLACDAMLSLCVMAAGMWTSLPLYAACAFVAFAAAAAAVSFGNGLWVRKVQAQWRGRVFAFIGMAGHLVGPLFAFLGAYLADRIFEPAMAGGGQFARAALAVVGEGGGRGLALVFVLVGAGSLLLALYGLSQARFRALDQLVPDSRGDQPVQAA